MFNFIKNLFIKKDWEIIQEFETDSQLKHYLNVTGKYPTPIHDYHLDKMTARKHITLLKCKNTGKLKRYVERF